LVAGILGHDPLESVNVLQQGVEVVVGELDADGISGREEIGLEGERHRSRHLADDLPPARDQLRRAHVAVFRSEELDVDLAEVGGVLRCRARRPRSVASAGGVLSHGVGDVFDD